jgi:hypothetical protein
MTTNIDIEIKVIKRFIINKKQDRYLSFIQKAKTRRKFTQELAHFSSQLRDFEEIKGNERKVIVDTVAGLGDPTD